MFQKDALLFEAVHRQFELLTPNGISLKPQFFIKGGIKM